MIIRTIFASAALAAICLAPAANAEEREVNINIDIHSSAKAKITRYSDTAEQSKAKGSAQLYKFKLEGKHVEGSASGGYHSSASTNTSHDEAKTVSVNSQTETPPGGGSEGSFTTHAETGGGFHAEGSTGGGKH